MWARKRTRFPDAAQRASGATLIRDRSGLGVYDDPGSAAHHSATPWRVEDARERAYGAAPRPGNWLRTVLAVGASGRYISARFPRNERLCGGAEQEGRALMAPQFVYHIEGLTKTSPGHPEGTAN